MTCSGACCTILYIVQDGKMKTYKQLQVLAKRKDALDSTKKIASMLYPYDFEKNIYGYDVPKNKHKYYFSCSNFNDETKLCMDYENRPPMCYDFPNGPLYSPENRCHHEGCDYYIKN